MSKLKFKFSKTIHTNRNGVGFGDIEMFEVSDADSWDEARKVVEKGVYERKLELDEEAKKHSEEMKKKFPNGLPPGNVAMVLGNPPGAAQVGHASTSDPGKGPGDIPEKK